MEMINSEFHEVRKSKNLARMKLIYKKLMNRRLCPYAGNNKSEKTRVLTYFTKCNSSKMLPVSENKRPSKIFTAWNRSTWS